MRKTFWLTGVLLLCLAGGAYANPGKIFFNPTPGDPNNYGVWWFVAGGNPSAITNGPNADLDLWPSNDFIQCVDASNGKPIDCTFSYDITGIDTGGDRRINFAASPIMDFRHEFGGHSHGAGTNPLFYQEPGTPIVSVDGGGPHTVSPDGRLVQGHTGDGVNLSYWLPEEAEAVQIEEFIFAPDGWICVSGCASRTSWEYHETAITGYDGFVQIDINYATDGSFPFYIKRNQANDPGHTDSDAEWGQQYTVDSVRQIASKYEEVTPWHGLLPLNDMSLPQGGVFDIHDDWNLGAKQEHLDHRFGKAVDIESIDNTGATIPCPDPSQAAYHPGPNNYLHGILFEHDKTPPPGTATPAPPPGTHTLPVGLRASFFCETEGRLHMNINSDNPAAQVPLKAVQP
jgi:hypothetical protein